MQIKFNEGIKGYGGYLTLYLSLIFGIVMSLLLALVSGAAVGATRLQSELVADLGLDSVFAEYNREILEQYELFFIDSSYGDGQGGIGELGAHISDYISYNINPQGHGVGAGKSLLRLDNPYLEIERASIASDNKGEVWKAQAIEYCKDSIGIGIINEVRNHLHTVEGSKLCSVNIPDEVGRQTGEFEEMMESKGITEYESVSSSEENGCSYGILKNLLNRLTGSAIVSLALPDNRTISGASANIQSCVSNRRNLNKGCGLHPDIKAVGGIGDSLIYNEYLMEKCGSFVSRKENASLEYQIEYILCGKRSDRDNLYSYINKLYLLRCASNYAFLSTVDNSKKREVQAVSGILCMLLGAPEAKELLTGIILGIWAMAEAAVDVRTLMDGGKIPLLKEKGEWCVSFISLISGRFLGNLKSNAGNGPDYEGYLRIFLALADKDSITMRSLDIVELDIRKSGGNSEFRIDRCIDYIQVNFGFRNTNGNEFVFKKDMCYY